MSLTGSNSIPTQSQQFTWCQTATFPPPVLHSYFHVCDMCIYVISSISKSHLPTLKPTIACIHSLLQQHPAPIPVPFPIETKTKIVLAFGVFVCKNPPGFQLILSLKVRRVMVQCFFLCDPDASAPVLFSVSFFKCLISTVTPVMSCVYLFSCTSSDTNYERPH